MQGGGKPVGNTVETGVVTGGKLSEAEYGSDYIVEIMRALGIEYAAFNPGASFRGLHDSIVNFGGSNIGVVQCLHEEVSVAIAHGYAKAAGKPMASIVHDVVGLQHATMAIYNAWIDRAPVYVMGGTGPVDASRRRPWIEWIHTANVQGNLVRDFVKFDDQPGSIQATPESMLRAWRTMIGEPQGPVYVNFDVDVQEQRAPAGLVVPDPSRMVSATRIAPDPKAIEQLAGWLVEADAPVIIAQWLGRNSETLPALVELAELTGCPVLAGEQRLNFPTDHGLCGSGMEKHLLTEADFILALDVWDLHRVLGNLDGANRTMEPVQKPGTRLAAVGLSDLAVRSWTHDFQALYSADLNVLADTSLAVPMLIEEVRRRISPERARAARKRFDSLTLQRERMREGWRRQARAESDKTPISLAYLAAQVWDRIRDREWVLGYHSHNPWPLRLWNFTHTGQYASYSGGGGIGYGIGGAIGVALAHRGTGKLIVDLQPDGDLLYCTSALWTLAQQRLPVLIVMHNNRSYYNSEEHAARMAKWRGRPDGRSGIGTHITEPAVDFAVVARGFGLYSEGPVTDPMSVGPALDRALKVVTEEGRAALVDVVTAAR